MADLTHNAASGVLPSPIKPDLASQVCHRITSSKVNRHRLAACKRREGAGPAPVARSARVYTTYLVICKTPKHLYVGHTGGFARRSKQHRESRGAQFTRRHGVVTILPMFEFVKRADAKRLETRLTKRLRELEGFTVAGGPWVATFPDGSVGKFSDGYSEWKK